MASERVLEALLRRAYRIVKRSKTHDAKVLAKTIEQTLTPRVDRPSRVPSPMDSDELMDGYLEELAEEEHSGR